jgi:hypothetical protein
MKKLATHLFHLLPSASAVSSWLTLYYKRETDEADVLQTFFIIVS